MPVKAAYLALAGGGAIFLWAGLKGKGIGSVLRNIVSGQSPGQAQASALITGANYGYGYGYGSGTVAAGTLDSMLSQLAKSKGWNAQQVNCWKQVISLEASGPGSVNSSSGAYGWGQALDHGTRNTAGCGRNEYGGYGLTDQQAQQANCGSSPEQLLWMANYIQDRYNNPCGALAFHQAHGYY